jgi:2-methylisocitrate lyase-like PEP mutase family enzyme
MMQTMRNVRDDFRSLHREGCFLMPNPHDVGTARLLAAGGFAALATTSSGFAATLGRLDMTVDRDTLMEHVRAMTGAVGVPVNVDAERCFADTPEGVKETVGLIADAGAAGCSIEDWDPERRTIDAFEAAVERVRAAAEAADESGLVLTARCEHRLRGVDDLSGTIERLVAYREAGAEVVYAPGLTSLDEISRVVTEVAAPVNVLLMPGGPSVAELAEVGVRRVSVGGLLARVAYGAVMAAAISLEQTGVIDPTLPVLDRGMAAEAFA